jgi:chemotaxis protein CheX
MFVKAFVQSIQNVFLTMMQLRVTVNEPYVKDGGPESDVSGIIGMSGDVVGSVVLSFPMSTAQACVALLTGEKPDPASPDFADAVGEIVNMVSGGAKASFKNAKVSISCPSVVMGGKHSLARMSDTPTIVIPCSTDCGDVFIEVSIKSVATERAAAAA